MKRFTAMLITLMLLLCCLPIVVSANGVPPLPYFSFTFSDLPEGTVYVDLLVKLSTKNPAYTPLVVENLPEGFTEDAEIIQYCENNYRSYTFHYKTALSMIQLSDNGCVYFFTSDPLEYDDSAQRSDHKEDIQQRGKIRIAMLDEAGNILQVSKPLSLNPKGLFEYVLGEFHYNAKEDTLDVKSGGASVLGFLLYVPLSILGVIITCVLERLMAWPFGLGKYYGGMIWRTNMVSQILMRIAYVPLYAVVFRQYWNAVVFLEILIYAGEFLFYCRRMDGVSRIRILLYTVAANSLSLLISLAFYKLYH